MANMTDSFKDVLLAGVGALAIGAEKSKELFDQFVQQGQLTVEQGKSLNEELKHKAETTASGIQDDVLAAHMAAMTPEQRNEFAKKVAELASSASTAGMVNPTTTSDEAAGHAEEVKVVGHMEQTEK